MNTLESILSALYGNFPGNIPCDLDGEYRELSDEEIAAHQGALKLRTSNAESVFFVYGVQEEADRDAFEHCRAKPSVQMWRDGGSILCWAFENGVPRDHPTIASLMAYFGIESLDDGPSLPGIDGWECVHADPKVFYTPERLAEVYLAEEPEPVEPDVPAPVSFYPAGATYNDASVITDYNEDDYKDCFITISLGANKAAPHWKRQSLSVTGLFNQFTKHEIGPKDGVAAVFADMKDGPRRKQAVEACTAIPLDYDTGIPSATIDSAFAKMNVAGARYSSHSHGKTSSELQEKTLRNFAGSEVKIDDELVRKYLREEKHWEEHVVSTVTIVERDPFRGHFKISHAPIDKNRLVVFLREPFVMRNEGDTEQEAWGKWETVIDAFAREIGLPSFDRACVNPHHLFYMPRHAKNRPHETSLFGGPLFDWKSLDLGGHAGDAFDGVGSEFGKTKSKSKTPEGRELGKWSYNRARGFQIVNVLEDHAGDKIRTRASSGYHTECPNDEHHTSAGDASDSACYAVNAADGGNEWFIWKCQHNACVGMTCLDMLGKAVKKGWVPESALWDEQYNIVELTEEEAAFGRPAPEMEAEILPTLAELKERIAGLTKNANDDEWSRDLWFPVLEAIEGSRLNPTDTAKAHDTLMAHCDLKRKIYDAEISELKRNKRKQSNEARKPPKTLDAKAIAKSDNLAQTLLTAFDGTFYMPEGSGGEIHLDLIDGRPWFVIGAESTLLCTPFTFDGAVVYADRNHDRALRVRVYDADNKVVPVEFDAELLGHLSGNELIGKLYAKGWVGDEPGRDFVLKHLRTRQLPGPTVYHKPGCRDGVFILANGAVIAPKDAKSTGVELHPDSLLKGSLKSGSLEAWIEAAETVFNYPDAWHFQVGALLGHLGPTIGYLGLLSLFVFLGGPSRGGKTTAKKVAAAHYAEADETKDGGCIVNAKGTPNSRENTNQMASCMVLCLDEFGKLPPKEQAEFAFEIAGGSGKRRMSKSLKAQFTKNWHGLCAIGSAELSLGQILALANEPFDAGMTARFLPITFPEPVKWAPDKFAPVEAMYENYGHSGEVFIRALLECDKKDLLDRLAEIVEGLLKATGKEDSALCASAAQNVALIQLVAEIAADRAGLIPKTFDAGPLTLKIWQDFLASDTAPIDAAERAFDTFLTNLSQGRGRGIVAFEDKDKPRSQELMGFHSVPATGKMKWCGKDKPRDFYYYVIYSNFVAHLGGGRADVAGLKRLLEKRGYLVRPDNKRGVNAMTWASFPGLNRGPYIVLRAEKVDDPEESVGAETVDDGGEAK